MADIELDFVGPGARLALAAAKRAEDAGDGAGENAAAIVEPLVDDATRAAGFTLRSDAITFAPKMTAGQTTTVREPAPAQHAALAGEVRLDGTAATVGEMIPNEGAYTWNGTALLRTGNTERQIVVPASAAAVAAQADIVGRIGEMRVVASNLPEWSHLFVDENRLIIAKVRRADAAMELALTEGSIIPPGTVGPAVAEVVPPIIDARFGAMSVVASDDPTYPAHIVAENLYKLISFRADGYVRLALTDDSIIPEGLVAALVEPAVQSVLTAGRVGAPRVRIYYSGDSLTAGAGGNGTSYPGTMAAILGLPYVNTAVGGTMSGSIGVRQGGIPMLLNLSAALPNDTTTEIDVASYSEEFTNNQSTQQYTGAIAGHPVVLRRYSSPAPNEVTTLKYTLRRTVLGSGPVVIPNGSRFEADLFADNELDVHYIQGGQNNPLVTRADRIKLRDDILRMIDRIGHDRFGVIGLKPTGPSQIIGTNGYGRKTEANAMIEDAIGWHLIRTYKYLASTGGLEDGGLLNSASQADLDCIAGDAIPPILLSDAIHGNASYYTLEGQFMARWHRGHAWLLGV